MNWANCMGQDRPLLFGKTSLPIIRLMHRLRIELFEFDEHKEHRRLATYVEVAKAAKACVIIDSKYTVLRFSVMQEDVVKEPNLEEGTEELNLEKTIE